MSCNFCVGFENISQALLHHQRAVEKQAVSSHNVQFFLFVVKKVSKFGILKCLP